MPPSRDNIISCVMALTAVGMVMSYSVAAARAEERLVALTVLGRHTVIVALGAGLLILLSRLDYHKLHALRWPLYFLSAALLVLVLVPGIGALRNNARRWFSIGGVSFQPSEVAKLAVVVIAAGWAAANPARLHSFFRGFLPGVFLVGLLSGLVLMGPDFGTAALVGLVGLLTLIVSGARVWHAGLIGAPAAVAAAALVHGSSYRIGRIFAFLDPWAHYDGPGYQVIQSLVALGSGGLLGQGPGASTQKLYFLPEPDTDFIYAIIGEEFGLAGTLIVLALFALLVFEGMRVSGRAPDLFGSLLAFGLATVIGVQAAINIAVVTASTPTKGIPLPFISMGGSSLMFCMAAMGVLLNIESQAVKSPSRAVGKPGIEGARP